MAFATVSSCTLAGVAALPVTVEVHTSGGLPGTSIVGLPQSAVRESKDRVRAAIENIGLKWPQQRIIINLAPADLPKRGGRFDLPIALGVLLATGQLPEGSLDNLLVLGELGLDGEMRSVSGILPTAYAYRASEQSLYIPAVNMAEALRSVGTRVHVVDHLAQAYQQLSARKRKPLHLCSAGDVVRDEALENNPTVFVPKTDMQDVFGQHKARRALEVAAAGSHNILMVGPPGTGKSMLASRLPGIQPPMSEDESMESASVASQATFPSRFQLVAAMNPCPCGYHDDTAIACRCGVEQIIRYQSRVSGPFLDRIDLHLQLRREIHNDAALLNPEKNETSRVVRERVQAAHKHQLKRQGVANAHLDASALREHVQLTGDAQSLFKKASASLKLSLRAQHRMLRVARTVADLEQSDVTSEAHLAECLCFRQKI